MSKRYGTVFDDLLREWGMGPGYTLEDLESVVMLQHTQIRELRGAIEQIAARARASERLVFDTLVGSLKAS